jgi:anti-anti-sigma regulatory factor
MENGWTNDLDKLEFTFESIGEILILTVGKFYSLLDYGFMWTVVYGAEKKLPEWQLIFNPDQLIIDFSHFEGMDQMGGEFFQLNEEYKTLKGKEILFCGINEKTDRFFRQFLEEEYLKFKQIDTKENAIQLYLSKKNNV